MLVLLLAAGCSPRAETVLKVIHAGSLTVPFERLEREFEAQHKAVDVQREAHGSSVAIRQVTELGRAADVVASADYALIDRLMIEPEPGYADWNIMFARNAMCIAYRSPGQALTLADWAKTLRDGDARIGMSDPNRDPCGYRALMYIHLAGALPGGEHLFEDLICAQSSVSMHVAKSITTIHVPSDVSYGGRLVLRPKEVDLVALLETGAIDYLFIYRSIAVQHGLRYFELPGEVNLSDPARADGYGRVRVRQFADNAEKAVEIAGSPIVYGLTIPSSAPNPEVARRFVRLLLSDRGRRILDECGQAPLVPALLSPGSRVRAVPFEL